MNLSWDSWGEGYGASVEAGDGPATDRTESVDVQVERQAGEWSAIAPSTAVERPAVVSFVDGVQHVDARGWLVDEAGDAHPVLAASYAAGVVRCDRRRGAAVVTAALVDRALLSAVAGTASIGTGATRYVAHRVGRDAPEQLDRELGNLRAALEATASRQAAAGGDGELLVVDGPLHGRRDLLGAVGYIKTQHINYLRPELVRVVTTLPVGSRTPVFGLSGRYSWYVRLPGPSGSPWSGIVRCECSDSTEAAGAIRLADTVAVTLPDFASRPYKDPRAPQNLIPIAGLERRLRGLLGDFRVLQRALRTAAPS